MCQQRRIKENAKIFKRDIAIFTTMEVENYHSFKLARLKNGLFLLSSIFKNVFHYFIYNSVYNREITFYICVSYCFS